MTPEGHEHSMRPRARRIPTRCIVCGYSLASLSDDALCPECGSPVWRSRHGTLLTMRHMPYLRSVRRGARMLAIGLWIVLITSAFSELSLSHMYPRDAAWRLNPRSVASLTDDVPLFTVGSERIFVTAAGLGATIRRESGARSIIVRIEQDGSVRSEGAATSPQPFSVPGFVRAALFHAFGLGEPVMDYAATGSDRIDLLRDHDVGFNLTDGMGNERLIRVDRDGRAWVRDCTTASGSSRMMWRCRETEDWPCFGWLGFPMRPAGLLGAILVIIATWPLTRRDRAFGKASAPIARVIARITVPPRLALAALSLPFVLVPFGIYPSQRVFNLMVIGPMGFVSRHGHMMLAAIAAAATLAYCASLFRALHDRRAGRAALALSILLPVLTLTSRLWIPLEQAFTGKYRYLSPPLTVVALSLAAMLVYALLATRLLHRLPRPSAPAASEGLAITPEAPAPT